MLIKFQLDKSFFSECFMMEFLLVVPFYFIYDSVLSAN